MYMAPEVLSARKVAENPGYRPADADLFALGVCLFMMRTSSPPFQQASESDRWYNLIKSNRSDLFWQAREHTLGQGYFSDEFKDLILGSLKHNPVQRISFADLNFHPWVTNEDCATEQEIATELQARKRLVEHYHREQARERRESPLRR